MRNERIAYVSGPVDARAVHQEYLKNNHPDNFGTSYLQQFFSVTDAANMEQLVVTTHDGLVNYPPHDGVALTNIPIPLNRQSGPLYHWEMIKWATRTFRTLVKFRPDIVILTAGQNYFFILSLISLFGAKVIVSYHCALYSPAVRHKFMERVYRFLNRTVLGLTSNAYMFVSDEIGRQVKRTLRTKNLRCVRFLPTYDRSRFDVMVPSNWAGSGTFNILYCGRIEPNKGVFDLLDIAERIKNEGQITIQIDICGDGGSLAALQQAIEQRGLSGSVTAHGHVNSEMLGQWYNNCHAVIVPTRSDFEEGFNKVCAEAIMARRPLITSSACPALEVVEEATVEAIADDVSSYYEAVMALATDLDLYRSKVAASKDVREMFFDDSQSYGETLQRILASLYPETSKPMIPQAGPSQ